MRNRLSNELAVCGFNAVAAIAEYHPDRIQRLFLREEHIKPLASLCKSLAEQKKPYKVCEDEELERLCKSPRHQGIVAMIDEPEVPPLSMEDVESWAAEGKTGLILDSVGNDQSGSHSQSCGFFRCFLCGSQRSRQGSPAYQQRIPGSRRRYGTSDIQIGQG